MQSAAGSRRRYNRRQPTNRPLIGGLDQGLVADGGRQMASMATAVAPSSQKQGRHFTSKKFADAPISLASKRAIRHE